MQGGALAKKVHEQCKLLVPPALPVVAAKELLERKGAAGHQKGKARGTLQSNTVDDICRRGRIEADTLEVLEELMGDELADWLEEMLILAAGETGEVINYFINYNKGDPPACANDLFHEDHPTRPEINTGRCIFPYMSPGQLASLRVRDGEVEVERPVERRPLDSATTRSPCWLHGFARVLYPLREPAQPSTVAAYLPYPGPYP